MYLSVCTHTYCMYFGGGGGSKATSEHARRVLIFVLLVGLGVGLLGCCLFVCVGGGGWLQSSTDLLIGRCNISMFFVAQVCKDVVGISIGCGGMGDNEQQVRFV